MALGSRAGGRSFLGSRREGGVVRVMRQADDSLLLEGPRGVSTNVDRTEDRNVDRNEDRNADRNVDRNVARNEICATLSNKIAVWVAHVLSHLSDLARVRGAHSGPHFGPHFGPLFGPQFGPHVIPTFLWLGPQFCPAGSDGTNGTSGLFGSGLLPPGLRHAAPCNAQQNQTFSKRNNRKMIPKYFGQGTFRACGLATPYKQPRTTL